MTDHRPTRPARYWFAVIALTAALGTTTEGADTPPTSPAAPAKTATAPPPKRLYVGGGIGLAFGDVTYIEVSPLLGYQVAPRILIGGSLLYRYRSDDRYTPDLTTSDYGASGFVRGDIRSGFFVQGEYEYLDYEYPLPGGGTDREGYGSVLLGPGFSSPIGGNGAVYFMALYNFSYDGDDINSPYDDPWIVRLGVGFGF